MKGLLCAVLLVAGTARAEAPSKSETSGLALGAGFGYQTPGLGVQAVWYQQLAPGLRIAPWLGAGDLPGNGYNLGGVAAGVMFLAGGRHRFVADLAYGLAGALITRRLSDNTVISARSAYGGSLSAGYEFMADGGFFFRPLLGVSVATEGQVLPALQLALGYKLW